MLLIHYFSVADLLEVVDRRAKLVVGDKPEEHSDIQSPESNGQGSQPKRKKSRPKAQNMLSGNDSPQKGISSSQTSKSNVSSDKDGTIIFVENDETLSSKLNDQPSSRQLLTTDNNTPTISLSESPDNKVVQNDAENLEVSVTVSDADTAMSTTNGELLNEKASDVPIDLRSLEQPAKDPKNVKEDNAGQDIKLRNADVPSIVDHAESQIVNKDSPVTSGTPLNDVHHDVEPLIDQKKQPEHKGDASVKLQDQLNEAQVLLKTANSTGQSKEARLARHSHFDKIWKVCTGLQARIQEYKYENAQLEELLGSERELTKSYEACIKQLQQDLSLSKGEVTRVESNMTEALAAKNAEIGALVSSVEALKKQAALSEGNLASLQANMEAIMRNRELTETRMMQAVREELASAERRAEEERTAHNATKMAAMEREVELEHRAVEASTALARTQRIADERTLKSAELEQKVALLEVECASLNQELQDMEAHVRWGQKKSTEEANQVIQIQAWQEEVERARQGQRDAENKLSSVEAELQKMRVEMAAMKRDAERYSRQEHMELEKRYRELTDLLYYKQTQLETMASEKAAAEFQLEKELKRIQETQVEAERSRVLRRPSSTWEEDTEMNALEPLPLHHRHMEAASIQLQKAAKILDSGAARATKFLWRYPTARLILLFYLVFVHLFLMYLLHRLQEQADNFAAREVAESMGLATSTLP
ncbi:hypothetical protein K2173_023736 [Erythroxylum novogranatense]|uniref:Golgin candidate 1 n=1 Tax=Erythroxylum novogranatense TaxID=1862640 RepID=A0AAV8TPD2_9ROSI|nr:hypothetical protein K2173_023736 [Erythroxylum novogranatense]